MQLHKQPGVVKLQVTWARFLVSNAFASTHETVKIGALGCIRDLSPLTEQHFILLHSVIQALPLYSQLQLYLYNTTFFFFFRCIHLNSPNLYMLTFPSSNSGRIFTLTFCFPDIFITVSLISRFVFDIVGDVTMSANSFGLGFSSQC